MLCLKSKTFKKVFESFLLDFEVWYCYYLAG